jgi:peptidoglycan/LPS O-acetylase OafA/YrhL
MTFRSDINGLRAIAIIGVLLFHFNKEWIPGGFAGVDVFFVISGYLMTGIIVGKLIPQKITLWEFYLARANRIIPALAVLCCTLLFLGWFFITPIDYRALAKHALSSITFLSNIAYWREISYFDAASSEKWLLHTWSLSVEWQFYLLYPLAMLMLRPIFGTRWFHSVMWLGFLLSLALSCWGALYKPHLSFYMLPFRAWEMLLGGLVYISPMNLSPRVKIVSLVSGLLLIVASYLLLSEELPWPGAYAILPALGAALVILANVKTFLFDNPVIRNIGLWSYSIYLWHWPLAVIGVYYTLPSSWIFWGIFLSLLFGCLSYRFVERFSFGRECARFVLLFRKPSVLISFPVMLLSAVVFVGNAFPGHYSKDVLDAIAEKQNRNPLQCMEKQDAGSEFLICRTADGQANQPSFIVVGDSHANAISSAVAAALGDDSSGINLVRAGCPYILGSKNRNTSNNEECVRDNVERRRLLNDAFAQVPVIFGARLAAYLFGQSDPLRVQRGDKFPSIYFKEEHQQYSDQLLAEVELHMVETICELTQAGRRVVIVGSIPEMGLDVPNYVSRTALLGMAAEPKISIDMHEARVGKLDSMLRRVAEECKAKFINPAEFLCDNQYCYGTENGRSLYYDGDHLSEFGNKKLLPAFSEFFAESNRLPPNEESLTSF